MRWAVATPFSRVDDDDWIPRYVKGPATFVTVPPGYDHDRSRRSTSAAQWRDYLVHAWHAWREVARAPRGQAGLVTSFPQLAVAAGLIKRLLLRPDVPLVAWCFNLGRTYGGWRGRLARLALRRVDLFVVHSRREIAVYAEWLGLPRDRFVFVPLSIRTEPARPEEDAESPFLLAMGTANRDYPTLVAAAAGLGLRTVIVAGPQATRGLDLPDTVTVLSNLDIETCHALCGRARVNVVALRDTTFTSGQVTVLEAMMLGKCVVATRGAGTEDYVADGVNGRLVPPEDPDALAAAIAALWDDPEARARLGAEARRTVLSTATFAAVAPAMEAVLAEASRRNRLRARASAWPAFLSATFWR